MAVQGVRERDGVEEVFGEVWRELLEIGERDGIQFDAFFEAETDGVADDLVGLAEGDAFVGEVGGGGHGVEIAGFGGCCMLSVRNLRARVKLGER